MSDPNTTPIQPRHRHGVDGLSVRSKDQQLRYAHDIEWNVVGPIPVDEFLEEFFPNPDLETESGLRGIDYNKIRSESFASVPDSPAREEMYEPLVSVKLSICRLSNRTDFSAPISTK